MKLHIKIKEDCEKFSTILSNLHRFSDNVILFFHKDHFYVQGMDFSQVALFEVKLDADFFDHYSLDEGDSSNIGIKSAIIQKIMNTRNVDQNITLEYNGNPNTVSISFENTKDDSPDFPKYFELPLIEIDTPLLSIPDKEYPVDFSISTKIFSGLISDLLLFGENIKVICDENKILMNSADYEGSIKVKLFDESDTNSKIIDYAIEQDFSLDIEFSNKYFTQFCAFSKLSHMINLYYANDMPMQLKYQIAENSYARFYLTSLAED